AELALVVDGRHYRLFAHWIRENRAAVVPLLRAEVGRPALPKWAALPRGNIGLPGGYPMAAAGGAPGLTDALDPDPVLIGAGKRKGYAAAALVKLRETDEVWTLFRFPADSDPTVRSYLIERLAAIDASSDTLRERFEVEDDVPARRALLIALGDYDFPPESAARGVFADRLLVLYQEHPDPGLHSAIDWLVRQRWGRAKEVEEIDARLA